MFIKALIDAMQPALLHLRAHLARQEEGEGEGQGLVEYALILVLVAVVVILILSIMGPTIGNIFSNITCGVFLAQSSECNF